MVNARLQIIKTRKAPPFFEPAKKSLNPTFDRHFAFARVIGKISEFRGIYSIQLVKISPEVNDPHEIYDHLTRIMVESLMFHCGPPVSAALNSIFCVFL